LKIRTQEAQDSQLSADSVTAHSLGERLTWRLWAVLQAKDAAHEPGAVCADPGRGAADALRQQAGRAVAAAQVSNLEGQTLRASTQMAAGYVGKSTANEHC
jgi:hypothetical protein